MAVLQYFRPAVFRSVRFFCVVVPYILYGIGAAVVSARQGEKDSGCSYAAGSCKNGSRFRCKSTGKNVKNRKRRL